MNEMEVISHLNVSVGLFPFTKILNLNIDHGPNVFGLCTIVGEMDHESADEIAQRTDESSETEVVTTASGQPARLFCGVVKNVSVNHQNEYFVNPFSRKKVHNFPFPCILQCGVLDVNRFGTNEV